MDSVSALLKDKQFMPRQKNVSREFQRYGYELAQQLNDIEHKSLYIRLAKQLPRTMLEKAKSYALDYPNAQSRAKIFMLKLKDLRELTRLDKTKDW